MSKRIHFIVYVLTAVLFVAAVVLYNDDNAEKAMHIFRYIPKLSTYEQFLAISESNNSRLTTNLTSCVTGVPCTYWDVVDLRVIVLTFNRADSLLKLLRSLDTLVLDGDSAALEIWIDRDHRKNDVHKRTFEVASEFRWKIGPTRVHLQVSLCSFQLLAGFHLFHFYVRQQVLV